MSDFLISPTAALTRHFVTSEREGGDSWESGSGASFERYGFRIGDCLFLHDLSLGVELSDLPHCYDLPNSRRWFRGLVNLRGNLLPVFDIKELIGSSHSEDRKEMLLVIGNGEKSAGLVIDGTPVHISIDIDRRVEPSRSVPEFLQNHVTAIYEHDGENWYDTDYESVFRSLSQRTDE